MTNEELIAAYRDTIVKTGDFSELEKELLNRLNVNIPKWQMYTLLNNAQQQHEMYKRLIEHYK